MGWVSFSFGRVFDKFPYDVRCQNPKCRKLVRIDIFREGYFEHGFICPHCRKITSADDMIESLVEKNTNSNSIN